MELFIPQGKRYQQDTILLFIAYLNTSPCNSLIGSAIFIIVGVKNNVHLLHSPKYFFARFIHRCFAKIISDLLYSMRQSRLSSLTSQS